MGPWTVALAATAAALATQSPAPPQATGAIPAPVNPQAQNATDQPNISGIWIIKDYVFVGRPPAERMVRTTEGTPAPLQPWAAELYRKRMEESDAGSPYATTASQCLPGGMPAMMLGAPYDFQIIQSPGQVTTIHEEQHAFRLIYLDEMHPGDVDPTFMGHSVGHWERATLVIDTVGLTDKTSIDFNGMPHSEQLHITERVRRLDADTLEDVLTFDDPKTFLRPWSTRRTYKRAPTGERLVEYICENQRNTPDNKGISGFGK
jgi:hypothetical protein